MEYIFKTNTYMKEYNYKKWFIDKNIIQEKRIKAKNINDAIQIFAKRLDAKDFTILTKNAIKNKEPLYRDDINNNVQQIGYVFTASQDFQDKYGNLSKQYIDLFVEIITITDTDF